jgi:colicin import membrane protein
MNSDAATEQQPSAASTPLDDLLARYRAGSIHTIEDANRAGEDVHKMHDLIEAQFAEEQKVCFPKFFANSCLIDAKERHRVALARVRTIEIEVNQFKRKTNVMAREKALAAKRDKEAAEQVGHANENTKNSEKHNVPETSQTVPSAASVKLHTNTDSRIAKHQKEVNKREAAEAANEEQRAKNIAAYEKKQQESEARQREIATKKLEKARAQSAKEASQPK